MKYIITSILFLLSVHIASAQCSNCDHNMTSNSPNPTVLSGQTICFNASRTVEGFGSMAHTLCVAPGVILNTQNYNPSNVTINVYGTLNMSNNFESNVTVNIFDGGTLNFTGTINGDDNAFQRTINISAGGTMQLSNNSNYKNAVFNNSGLLKFTSNNALSFGSINNTVGATVEMPGFIDKGTVNNSGVLEFKTTGIARIQNSGSTINNLNGGNFIAIAPEEVEFRPNTVFSNAGTANFKALENEKGTMTNAINGTINITRGFFSHGPFANYGILNVSCSSVSGTSCNDACLRFQDKGPNMQFVNYGTGIVTVEGSVTLCGGVVVHNNGLIDIKGNLKLENNNSGWLQDNSGMTKVTFNTSNTGGGTFTGGNLCTGTLSGTVNSLLSCGTPPTINNLTLTSCQNFAVTANIAATVNANASVVWGSLELKVGATTISANGTPTTISVINVGTYSLSYTNSAATITFAPVASFTGSATATYRIASLSGSTTTYSDFKNITTNISTRPAAPTSVINAVQ